MRVGTAIFSICAMIDRCLSLIQMLEAYFNNHEAIQECKVTFIVSIIAKSSSLLFIFLQSFFIFKYANIIINYGKNSAIIGLMHIICTNFCVFLRTVVHETVAEIRHHKQHPTTSSHSSSGHHDEVHHSNGYDHKIIDILSITNTTKSIDINSHHHYDASSHKPVRIKQLGCINTISFTSEIAAGVQEAQEKLAPYLYPCIIGICFNI